MNLSMISPELQEILCCPECDFSLKKNDSELQCEKCGIKIPIVDNIPRFHETTWKSIIESTGNVIRNPLNWTGWRRKNYAFFLKELAHIEKSSLLLDVGAGTSPFHNILSSYKTFRVDFEPYEGIHFLTDLNRPLPIPEKVFDCIIMSNLLEHIPEPLRLLKECNRILKKNGRLILTVPFLIKIHQAPYDFLRYTEYMLQRLFLEGGFEDFRIEKIGNIFDVQTQISSSLYHFISTSSGSKYRFVRAIIVLNAYPFGTGCTNSR